MAQKFYMTIKGTKQGKILGEPRKTKGRNDYIELTSFEFQTIAPLDAKSGQPVGKRRHNPIAVRKEVGLSDAQLFQAYCNSEVLSEVIIAIYPGSSGGTPKETNVPRIILSNSIIDNYRAAHLPQVSSPSPGKSGSSGGGKGELVVERITLTNALITKFTSANGSLPGSRGSSGKGLVRLEFDFQRISTS